MKQLLLFALSVLGFIQLYSQTETKAVHFERGNGWKEAAKIGFKGVLGGSGENHNFSQIVNSGGGYFTFHTNYNGVDERVRIANNGFLGVGFSVPQERLHVNGNVKLSANGKYLLDRGSSTSEMFVTGHGQGAGWMINARYTGSGTPETNAVFNVNQGSYNTGAGYLDFDGNARMWTLFVSSGNSIIDNTVPFVSLAKFRHNQYISLSTNGIDNQMYINNEGDIGIGTTEPDAKLAVNGNIHATEVKVSTTVPAPDYVFEEDYPLASLEEIKSYITVNKHLPEVPSAKEMEANGINLSEMNMLLLKKVEELTLLLIEQNESNKHLTKRVKLLEELNTSTIKTQ